jgi:creatinine amidohydrolase/Fe(II)-dependent formamide hydrolase-like protein
MTSPRSVQIRSAWSWFATACALSFFVTLPAQAASSVYLEELTTTELRDAIRAGTTIAIIPAGGTEQNGAHMTLGKHNARARILAGRIAQALGNSVVAPVVAYVPEGTIEPPSAHMRSAGTITVPDDVFEKTLESAARSLKLHGIRDVVLIGDHGGYQKNLQAVAARLNKAWAGTPARAHAIVEYYRAAGLVGHAEADDTSFMLAVEPSMVRTPGAATAEAGKKTAETVVSRSVEAIRKAVRR